MIKEGRWHCLPMSFWVLLAMGFQSLEQAISPRAESRGQPGAAARQSTLPLSPGHSPPPPLQSLTWKEREEGGLDIGQCAPGSHSCGSLRRNLDGGQASARLPRVPLPISKILLVSSHLSLGSSNSKEPLPRLSQFGRCNWGKGWRRARRDLSSTGPLMARTQLQRVRRRDRLRE